MRAVAVRSRWVWGVSGLATAVALAVPGSHLITSAGMTNRPPWDTVTRTVIVSQPVTSVDVQSCGDPVQVNAGNVSRVRVTESIIYGPKAGEPPTVPQSVSGRRLALTDPACTSSPGGVGFTLTVPPDVTVTAATQGAPVSVSGIAGANLDSGGGNVLAAGIDGPLTVSTGSGMLLVNGLDGTLDADTGGGNLLAQGVASATATVTTGGGNARIVFVTAPDTVTVSSDGGAAMLTVPGGPYALTASSDGGPESVGIAIAPRASRSISVSTGGGPLRIRPAGAPGARAPRIRRRLIVPGRPLKPGAPKPPPSKP
jgi:hypothetical protein